MSEIKYKTYWAYGAKAKVRKELLADFVLDIFYLMGSTGVIPPLDVLNQVLQGGGSDGGMGPGTTWRPFQISVIEYQELVQALLSVNVEEAKKKHPYVNFQEIVTDEELNQKRDYREWRREVIKKYLK